MSFAKNGLITLKEYKTLSPKQQGYATYMQAEIPGSCIPKKCPYTEGWQKTDWESGNFAGMLEAQDHDD